MTLRIPLYTRFVGWFLLNLVIIGLVVVVAFNLEFRLGPSSPLRGGRGQPLLSLARLVTFELSRSPRARWDAVLERRSGEYGVDLHLFAPNAKQLAGQPIQLPAVLRERLRRGPRPPGPPPKGQSSRPPNAGVRPPALPPGGGPPPPGGPHQGLGPAWVGPGIQSGADGRGPPPPAAGFSLRTSDPTRYWVVMAIPVYLDLTSRPSPGLLVASSKSITGGGLFLDPRPVVSLVMIVVVLSALLWFPMVYHVTRPLGRITNATEQIARGRFEGRLDESRGDEIGRLSRAINEMSSRLAALVQGQKRFLGDIAHELSSPVARIQLGLGIMERHVEDANRERLDRLADDVAQMSQLIDELLSFSRAELSPQVNVTAVDVSDLAQEAVQREQREGVEINCDLGGGLRAQADPDLLARAIGNLLRNAVRYAGDAGPIEVTVRRDAEGARISVCDLGPGVAPEHLGQLFDPFYRPQPARDRQSGGVGLGLAIVKSCVEACQGRVEAINRVPAGFCVTIVLRPAPC